MAVGFGRPVPKGKTRKQLKAKKWAATRLVGWVGKNLTMRVFTFGTEAVIVEHERGVRRIEIEQPR